jgi:hypothetical protein
VRTEFTLEDNYAHSLAFLKRGNFQFEAEAAASVYTNMVQVINVGYSEAQAGSNPFTLSQCYVQNCFIPIFSTYKSEIERKQSVDKQSYGELLKKLNELNLAFIKCR